MNCENILKNSMDKNEISKAIDELEDIRKIAELLVDSSIRPEIKNEIMNQKINSANIMELTKCYLLPNNVKKMSDLIEKNRKCVLNDAVDMLTIKQIKKELKSDYEIVSRTIYQRRYDDLREAIKQTRLFYDDALLNTKTPEIAKMILEIKSKEIGRTIKNISSTSILDWLISKNISDEMKNDIVKYNKESLQKAVSEKKLYDIRRNYIDNGIPRNIEEIILSFKTKEIEQEKIKEILEQYNNQEKERIINKIDADIDFINDLLNDNLIDSNIKKQLILKFVNKDNILEYIKLNTLNYSNQEVRILELKNNDFNQAIDELTVKDIKRKLFEEPINRKVQERICQRRYEDLKKAINSVKFFYGEMLFKAEDPATVSLIQTLKKDKLSKYFKSVGSSDILKWLNSSNISIEQKEYICENNKRSFISAINDLKADSLIINYLKEKNNIPDGIVDEIIAIKRNELIDLFRNDAIEHIINRFRIDNYHIKLKEFIVNELINQDNIINGLRAAQFYTDALDIIVKLKEKEIKEFIKKININDLIENRYALKEKSIIEVLLLNYSYLFIDKINELTDEQKYKVINEPQNDYVYDMHIQFALKREILISLGFVDDIEDIEIFLNGCLVDDILKKYPIIIEKLKKCNINYRAFVQYGVASQKYFDWPDRLLEIDDLDEFCQIEKYMNSNYYLNDSENNVNEIKNFLEMVTSYKRLYPLLKEISQNDISLTNDDKLNLRILFENRNIKDVPDYKEISSFRKKQYDKIKEHLNYLTENDSELIDLLLKQIVSNETTYVNTESLRLLEQDNPKSKIIKDKIEQLKPYTMLNEKIMDASYKLKLEILKSIYDSYETMVSVQNAYINYSERVRELYELEIKVNLSNLEKYENEETIDLSDKNYILCAHVKSERESIDDLVNGRASGNSNFISISPISYKGQKYYYDLKESNVVLLYNSIPKGSFICSSIVNMGSNSYMRNNDLEIKPVFDNQRGILETSIAGKHNSEILFYREGLKPCGIRIEKNHFPTVEQERIHKEYNLPYIVTQAQNQIIENPIIEFEPNEMDYLVEDTNKINSIISEINKNKEVKANNVYTGREIAILTDVHSMFEPLLAILEDIRKRNITEIYSLGDNVGLGPNPCDVIDLLEEYNVKSVAGNSEYYNTLGTEPFDYFDDTKRANQEWTYDKLGQSRINIIKAYPASIDLLVGKKKIALCHFINDVRWDYSIHSTWSYQANFERGKNARQFLYTNSDDAKEYVGNMVKCQNSKQINGYISAYNEPLFNGKTIDEYSAIFEGHVHFEMVDKINHTRIYTLRAAGMGWKDQYRINSIYYVLKEKKDGTFDIEKVETPFNKNSLICNIKSSTIPYKEKILSFVK